MWMNAQTQMVAVNISVTIWLGVMSAHAMKHLVLTVTEEIALVSIASLNPLLNK